MHMILLLGLNLYKGKEPKISYTLGTLAQTLKDNNIEFEILDLDLNASDENNEVEFIIENLKSINLKQFNYVGISVFVWSEKFINDVCRYIKKQNPNIKIVLGGPQITYSTDIELLTDYQLADYYIRGYGENALVKLLKNQINMQIINSNISEITTINSPYKNIIPIESNQRMIRIETKRGCPYSCAFCAHYDKNFKNKTICFQNQRIIEDLQIIKLKKVMEVNVIDPLFNIKNAEFFLNKIIEMKIPAKFKFQTRYELMNDKLIDLCSKANVHLEFGLQTADEFESVFIDRKNDLEKVKTVMKKLNTAKISYETSIIYGLPFQNYNSFAKTIDFVLKYGNDNLKAFPLELLKGTKLFVLKEKLGFKTNQFGRFDTPVVVASHWFSFKEWKKMYKLSKTFKNIQIFEKSLL